MVVLDSLDGPRGARPRGESGRRRLARRARPEFGDQLMRAVSARQEAGVTVTTSVASVASTVDDRAPLLDVNDLQVTFGSEAGAVTAVRGLSLRRQRARGAGDRRRVGLRQVGLVAGDDGPAAGEGADHRLGAVPGSRAARPVRQGAVQDPRRQDLDDLPGSAVRAHAGLHRRRPGRRGDPDPQRREHEGRAASVRSSCSISSASRTRRSASRPSRTSSRAACGSAR